MSKYVIPQDASPGSQGKLQRNALSTLDLLIAGMSYMAPGFSLFFTTAIIASIAGIYSPLTYLFAGLGVLCTGATLAEFSRRAPSAGALQTFVGKGFGQIASIGGGIILVLGYVCLQASVAVLFGGWSARLLADAFGLSVPWPLLTVGGVLLFTLLMVRGVHLSIRTTWILFLIEFILTVIIGVTVLVRGGAQGLSAEPLNIFALNRQTLPAIAFGMVYATFSFVGFEGAISFAEETPNPRRALPIAVLGGIVAMSLLYIVTMYAAVIGFGLPHIGVLGQDPEPIRTLAHRYVPLLEPLLLIAVLTSISANLMAGGNANARILFNLGREGALPMALGRIHPRYKTPYVAILIFMFMTLVLGILASWFWDYLTAFGNISGFGSLLALIIYLAATVALPVYVRRAKTPFKVGSHLIVPVIGALIWLIPLWGSIQPGQVFPLNIYPYLALGIIVLAVVYAIFAKQSRRIAQTGTLIAVEDESPSV